MRCRAIRRCCFRLSECVLLLGVSIYDVHLQASVLDGWLLPTYTLLVGNCDLDALSASLVSVCMPGMSNWSPALHRGTCTLLALWCARAWCAPFFLCILGIASILVHVPIVETSLRHCCSGLARLLLGQQWGTPAAALQGLCRPIAIAATGRLEPLLLRLLFLPGWPSDERCLQRCALRKFRVTAAILQVRGRMLVSARACRCISYL